MDRRWSRPSKGVLQADERRDLVAQAIVVELECQVHVEQQTIDQIRFQTGGAAQRIERLARKSDVRKHRSAVERVKLLLNHPLGIDHVRPQEIEGKRQLRI